MVWTAILSNGINTTSEYIMTDTPCHEKAVAAFYNIRVENGMFLVAIIKGRHEVYV
jgi:hypothetical protein